MRHHVDALKVQEIRDEPDKLLEFAAHHGFQDAGMILTFGITSQSLMDMRAGGHPIPKCHMDTTLKDKVRLLKILRNKS